MSVFRCASKLKPTNVMKDIIYIKTNRIGYIPQVRMQGPIVTPIPVTRAIAKDMVVSGIETYKVDKKTKKVTLLTLQNIYPEEKKEHPDCNFKDKGEQKPPVPTSGVAQNEPVQHVTFQGVSTHNNAAEEEDTAKENSEENSNESTQNFQEKNDKTEKPQGKNRRNKK